MRARPAPISSPHSSSSGRAHQGIVEQGLGVADLVHQQTQCVAVFLELGPQILGVEGVALEDRRSEHVVELALAEDVGDAVDLAQHRHRFAGAFAFESELAQVGSFVLSEYGPPQADDAFGSAVRGPVTLPDQVRKVGLDAVVDLVGLDELGDRRLQRSGEALDHGQEAGLFTFHGGVEELGEGGGHPRALEQKDRDHEDGRFLPIQGLFRRFDVLRNLEQAHGRLLSCCPARCRDTVPDGCWLPGHGGPARGPRNVVPSGRRQATSGKSQRGI
ncbi:MAG: hypothetical protein V3T72_07880 [Thermoanaerobaculia bacterium]